MRFIYGKQDMQTPQQAQENCYLLTNGLGGYSSLSMAYSATRNDQGILIAASAAPTVRHTLVQRMKETLLLDGITYDLSTQETIFNGVRHHKIFINSAGKVTLSENGYTHLTSFIWEDQPKWLYEICGIRITRQITMQPGHNTVVLHYEINNRAETAGTILIQPAFLCAPKGQTPQECPWDHSNPKGQNLQDMPGIHSDPYWDGQALHFRGYEVYIRSDAAITATPPVYEHVFYSHDQKDGRTTDGYLLQCLQLRLTAGAGENISCDVILSDRQIASSARDIREEARRHIQDLQTRISLQDPVARQLAISADAYITHRDSTDGKTIVAGYPFFADWGRDTMISMPGCTLACGRYDTAESILRTFLQYERGGLVPNLFPEGGEEPRYNTVDAALLLINSIWLYYQKTGNRDFLTYAYPVMQRIIDGYCRGTLHGIHMDEDGLICAGQGLDQVTWMDVCVDGILPTPRHGKPVEINAYWYNALCIMEEIQSLLSTGLRTSPNTSPGISQNTSPNTSPGISQNTSPGISQTAGPIKAQKNSRYGQLAEKVKSSFLEKFWMEDRGYLKDVISDTKGHEISCMKHTGSSWANENEIPGTEDKGAIAPPSTSPDLQLRCNQIWAITLPYTMLSQEQERRVVDAVYRSLYTSCGLRTLDPADPQFHPTYGGEQKQRDLAYHQGTVWVFPLGAFYKAYLKVNLFSPEAREWVRDSLTAIEPMLREGCIGQLPEIYDGLRPTASRGCFAQAWSVGEILTVYELLESCETGSEELREKV